MGSDARWDSSTWKSYEDAHIAGKTADKIFTSRKLLDPYNPALISLRESKDSDINPNSTSISLFLDVTGSMGMLAEKMMRDGLNTAATELIKRAPVTDPHIMLGAVGDAECDRAPLQLTQWESSTVLAEQTKELFIEGGGGGNSGESYMLPHVFHAFKTETDCWAKRRKKGYLVTIGDEPTLDGVTKSQAKNFLGIDLQQDLTAEECIALASERYEVLHVVVAQGSGCSGSRRDRVISQWNSLLPQRVLILEDYTKLAETIVSAIQVIEGASKSAVAGSWDDKSTALVVANAVSSLAERGTAKGIRRIGL
jgi:hypothetical protein